MAGKAGWAGAWTLSVLVLSTTVAGCNAPRRAPAETRMYPKAPLEVMGPWITPEPTTGMARLAHLNRPGIVEIPAESVVAPAKP